jgi:hypothetical protein
MNKFKDFMTRRRYSPRTIEVYTSLVGLYLSVLKNRNPDDLTDEDIGREDVLKLVELPYKPISY